MKQKSVEYYDQEIAALKSALEDAYSGMMAAKRRETPKRRGACRGCMFRGSGAGHWCSLKGNTLIEEPISCSNRLKGDRK